MQIVIDIPENRWKEIQHTATTDTDSMNWYERKISNGTPLLEHHGKWIYDGDQIICSRCRTAFGFMSLKTASNFCPECGAEMTATKEGE